MRIISVSGIGVHLHWTLLVLMAGLFGVYVYRGGSLVAAMAAMGLVSALLACVVLHELGHALTAKRFGIKTRDITLYPFGGIARLEGRAMTPSEELWVSLAGPAVNVAIAAGLYVLSSAVGGQASVALNLAPGGLLGTLIWLNLALAAFNMIPAFPMDGGRVLRAGLATQVRYEVATQVAVLIGTLIAAGFVVVGLITLNPMLVFVGVFVFLGASQEARMARPQ